MGNATAQHLIHVKKKEYTRENNIKYDYTTRTRGDVHLRRTDFTSRLFFIILSPKFVRRSSNVTGTCLLPTHPLPPVHF